ncbi:MAG: MFS transporter [Sphingomonas sp.]|uniref:MFS transporter n=1 Tax=Sphingomonas sp. TaxID=28214 RepID=UPI003F80B60B
MTEYVFKPHERPTLPGSPATPDHPTPRRIVYFVIGCLIGITQGLGNALVTVNLNFAQGTLDLYTNESAWLTAAYFMTNVTANLLLVKYRQQFGLQPFIRYTLAAYAATTLMHLFVHDFWTSVLVRAMSGVAASGLSTLTILYFFQALPAAKRLAGVMIGICIPQLATPLARILSPHLLEWGDWHNLYWLELGLALATLAAVMSLPLPASEREKVFEPADFLTFGLLAPGLWLLIAALSEGRIEWWTDQPWIGWALAASVALIASAVVVEHQRANPLINTRWLASREILRLMVVAASIRVLLSEQAFGSVGLLNVLGMINDQMITLNWIIVLASIAGLATAVFTFRPGDVALPITVAVVLIVIGSFMDADATNLTRPSSFYVSQALIGFASLLFLAQAMVIGIARTLLAGGRNFVSFVVLFGLSQSVGGLLGSAFLGTFQVLREKFHSHELVQRIVATDPLVAARIRASGGAVAGAIGDPTLRGAQGVALLGQQVAREANVLAFNDVFLLVGVLAILMAIWGYSIRWSIRRRGEVSPVVLLQQRSQQAAEAQEGQ